MFCKYCGAQVNSGKFCPDCGKPLEQPAQQPVYPAYQPAPVYAQPGNAGRPLGSRSALDVVRSVAGSSTMLVAAICVTLAAVLNVLSNMTMKNMLPEAMDKLMAILQQNGIDTSQFPDMMQTYGRTTSVTGSLGSLIPAGLIAAGIWMLYASARQEDRELSTGGLTLLKVMAIITLVLVCLGAALCLIVMIAGFALTASVVSNAGSRAEVMSIAGPLFLLVGVLAVLIFVLAIVFQAKQIKTINTVRDTVTSGVPSDKVSTFVAVMLFIMAACEIPAILSFLGMGQVFGALAAACTAAAEICFGILIYKYRSEMRALMGIAG